MARIKFGAQNGKNRQIKSALNFLLFSLRQIKSKFFLAYTKLCNDPKIKGSLNEMKFGTQINLVILNMAFILNLKIPVIF